MRVQVEGRKKKRKEKKRERQEREGELGGGEKEEEGDSQWRGVGFEIITGFGWEVGMQVDRPDGCSATQIGRGGCKDRREGRGDRFKPTGMGRVRRTCWCRCKQGRECRPGFLLEEEWEARQ